MVVLNRSQFSLRRLHLRRISYTPHFTRIFWATEPAHLPNIFYNFKFLFATPLHPAAVRCIRAPPLRSCFALQPYVAFICAPLKWPIMSAGAKAQRTWAQQSRKNHKLHCILPLFCNVIKRRWVATASTWLPPLPPSCARRSRRCAADDDDGILTYCCWPSYNTGVRRLPLQLPHRQLQADWLDLP